MRTFVTVIGLEAMQRLDRVGPLNFQKHVISILAVSEADYSSIRRP